jgi:DNA-binding MarR family transcriptional regulator
VLHVQDIDFRAHTYSFRETLRQLKAWSDAHKDHTPIVITMNAKSDVIDRPEFVRPLPFDRAAFEAWDKEIVEELGRRRLITPRSVQGKSATLREAVLAKRWPLLKKSRGKFLFVLDEGKEKSDVYRQIADHLMFLSVSEEDPESAFLILNDPKKEGERIRKAVAAGYLVRTRADADTREARTNDYSRWEAAKASGAQVISTDYYLADPELGTGYVVRAGDLK